MWEATFSSLLFCGVLRVKNIAFLLFSKQILRENNMFGLTFILCMFKENTIPCGLFIVIIRFLYQTSHIICFLFIFRWSGWRSRAIVKPDHPRRSPKHMMVIVSAVAVLWMTFVLCWWGTLFSNSISIIYDTRGYFRVWEPQNQSG